MRQLFRSGAQCGVTSGRCLGYLQANRVVLPVEAAGEFSEFCGAHQRTMPLIDVTEPGDPVPRRVAPMADLRTDLPRYRVYLRGQLACEPADVRDVWRDDLVAFLLGCSFTAESKLLEAGVRLRRRELGQNVPMFITSLRCTPVGRFRGPVVVSMRPIAHDSVEVARRVTADYPLAHGVPLHVGDPRAIGIHHLLLAGPRESSHIAASTCLVNARRHDEGLHINLAQPLSHTRTGNDVANSGHLRT